MVKSILCHLHVLLFASSTDIIDKQLVNTVSPFLILFLKNFFSHSFFFCITITVSWLVFCLHNHKCKQVAREGFIFFKSQNFLVVHIHFLSLKILIVLTSSFVLRVPGQRRTAGTGLIRWTSCRFPKRDSSTGSGLRFRPSSRSFLTPDLVFGYACRIRNSSRRRFR